MPPKVLDLQESPLNTPQKPLEQKTTTKLLIFILHITWLIVATPLTNFATAKVMAPPATTIAHQNPKWPFRSPFSRHMLAVSHLLRASSASVNFKGGTGNLDSNMNNEEASYGCIHETTQ